jgi:hypothetical protein
MHRTARLGFAALPVDQRRGASHRVVIRPWRIRPARRTHSVSGVLSPASLLIASLVCRTDRKATARSE